MGNNERKIVSQRGFISQYNSKDDSKLSKEELMAKYEKHIYDLQQLLEISRSLCSTLQTSTLIESILYTCMGQMHVLGAGIFIMDSIDADCFKLAENYSGIDVSPCIDYTIPVQHPIIENLSKEGKAFTLNEFFGDFSIIKKDSYVEMILGLKPTLMVPLLVKNHLNGFLLLGERIDLGEGSEYTEYEKNQILAIASLAAIAINNSALVERSSIDLMTHLKQRYYFFNALSDALSRAYEKKTSLCVMMFDIDHFKSVNDTCGHACGDYVLMEVARIIRESVRADDIASRYGGEEFTVLVNNADREGGMIVAERIRSRVENMDFIYENTHLKITISAGVAVYNGEQSPIPQPKRFVDIADKAMYFSKRSGRNRVSFLQESHDL